MMDSLIGDRFLKRFFGNRSDRRQANATDEAMVMPENKAKVCEVKDLEAEKPTEHFCPPGEDLLKKDSL